MCGIIGAIAKQPAGFYAKDGEIIQQMLYADALRGWDATGVFGVTKQNDVDIMKAAIPSSMFAGSEAFEKFKKDTVFRYKMVVGHNRKATHGDKNSADSHPFWSKDDNIVLVHNGMISNHKDFCKDSTVDSQAVCNALQTMTPQEVFSKLEGSYAIVWYNVQEHKMYFIRNDARPLFFVHTHDCIYFGSEAEMIQWITKRNNTVAQTPVSLTPRMLYSIDLTKTEVKEEGVIALEKKFVPPTTTPTGTTGGRTCTARTTETVGTSLNAFFTSEDIHCANDVMNNFSRGEQVIFMVSSYDERQHTTTLSGNLINIDVPHMDVQMIVGKDLVDQIDLTKPIVAQIMGMLVENQVCKLFLGRPVLPQSDYIEMGNYLFTEDMYFDDDFPAECDCCSKQFTLETLKGAELFMDKGKVSFIGCKECMASPTAH